MAFLVTAVTSDDVNYNPVLSEENYRFHWQAPIISRIQFMELTSNDDTHTHKKKTVVGFIIEITLKLTEICSKL